MGNFVEQWFKGVKHRYVRELFIKRTVNKRIEGPEEKDDIYSLKACITSKEQTKIKKLLSIQFEKQWIWELYGELNGWREKIWEILFYIIFIICVENNNKIYQDCNIFKYKNKRIYLKEWKYQAQTRT